MKKLLSLLSVLFIVIQILAQAPQKMSFQAVIRKSNNGLVMMQPVSMRISIIQGNANGTIVYQETHKPITNSNGLVTLEIGTGTIISGVFSDIDWGNGPFYIKTETDPFCGTDYTIVGVSEFLSVPYALFALNSNYKFYSGISKSLLNLNLLNPGINFSMTVTKGLAYTESNNIIISNDINNHVHAIVVAYNPINGLMLLNPVNITGTGSYNDWTVNLDGSSGSIGAVGLQGKQGIIGLTGLTGATGSQGDIGLTGATGSNGSQGLIGLTGAKGSQGIIGLTGLTGFTGLTGSQGLVGLTGPIGATGSQGIIGLTGAKGSQGIIGLTGATGATGYQGFTGPTGMIGPAGSAGKSAYEVAMMNGFVGTEADFIASLKGANGVTGNTGSTGLQGLQGSTGGTGLQGAIGLTGANGTQGIQGEIGNVGLSGSIGPIGPIGSSGPQGFIGLTGSAGKSAYEVAMMNGFVGTEAEFIASLKGANGVTGNTGSTGLQGLQGSTGGTGLQGAIGLTGANGTQGIQGEIGSVGLSGSIGPIGFTGPQGLIGLTGLTGSQGLQGLQGNIGAAGATGLTGLAGKSAYEVAMMNGFVGTEAEFIASLKGANGVTGNTGSTGLQGLQGSTGGTGLQGAIGLTGANGTQGIQGEIGNVGLTGSIGPIGPIGSTGPQGLIGLTGFTGVQGSQGIQGNTGNIGANGVDGATGQAGPQGIIGNTGSQGVIGLTGAEGPIGPKGGFDPSTILSPLNGGTGKPNDALSTLTINGSNPMIFTNTGATSITLPTTGILYGTATSSFSSANLLNSLSDKTGSGTSVFSVSPEFTAIPTAPTVTVGTNTTQLATTAFVMQNNSPKQFSIAAGNEISTNTTIDAIAGDMTLTPGAGKYFVSFNSQYTLPLASLTGSVSDLSLLYTDLMAKTNTSTHGVSFGNEIPIVPGVYNITGASTVVSNIILDGLNQSNPEFVFKFNAAFSTAANITISYINGASACNVYWIAEGAITLGAGTIIKGTMLSNNGSVTAGSLSNVEGRMYSKNGALALNATTLYLPTGFSSSTNYGSVNSFAAFTSSGDVNNVGSSVITGDIGTNLGSIINFNLATINGIYYTPSTLSNPSASFSVFQNGVLIPFSTRTRSSSLNLSEISLTAIATVGDSQPIDIRWKVDAGTIKLQNRILTLIAVK